MNPLRRILDRLRPADRFTRARKRSAAEIRQTRGGVFSRLQSLLQRRRVTAPVAAPDEPPRFDFSYTVYWLKVAQAWDPTRRASIASALARVLDAPEFRPTMTERRFRVEGLDQAYSGVSLLALSKVLQALVAADMAQRGSA
jgi:hypothetical protein